MLELDRALQAAADPAHRATIRDHFGSNVDPFYGVTLSAIRECATAALAGKDLPLKQRWDLCDELTATVVFEDKIAAFHWATQDRKQWDSTELLRDA